MNIKNQITHKSTKVDKITIVQGILSKLSNVLLYTYADEVADDVFEKICNKAAVIC